MMSQRDRQLHRRQQRERAYHMSETPEQREERLRKQRDRDRAKRARVHLDTLRSANANKLTLNTSMN